MNQTPPLSPLQVITNMSQDINHFYNAVQVMRDAQRRARVTETEHWKNMKGAAEAEVDSILEAHYSARLAKHIGPDPIKS